MENITTTDQDQRLMEELEAIVATWPIEKQMQLINRIRAGFGFPPMSFEEAATCGGFTAQEKAVALSAE
jgi:hypothetical protein